MDYLNKVKSELKKFDGYVSSDKDRKLVENITKKINLFRNCLTYKPFDDYDAEAIRKRLDWTDEVWSDDFKDFIELCELPFNDAVEKIQQHDDSSEGSMEEVEKDESIKEVVKEVMPGEWVEENNSVEVAERGEESEDMEDMEVETVAEQAEHGEEVEMVEQSFIDEPNEELLQNTQDTQYEECLENENEHGELIETVVPTEMKIDHRLSRNFTKET